MEQVNGNRLREFRQVRDEIRGSAEYLIVGLDIGKERDNAFFGTATGRTLHKGMFFDNTYEGFQELLIRTDALKVQYGLRKVVFGLEPTANYHKPLGEYLIKGGHLVVLVSAAATAKNRDLLDGRWDKHDTKDAANVADLIAQGKCLYYDCPGEDLRSLRGLLSLKRRLKKEEHGLRVRIRNQLLAQYFPEMDQHFGSQASLNVVSRCLDPSTISVMEYDEFCRAVRLEKQTWRNSGGSPRYGGLPNNPSAAASAKRYLLKHRSWFRLFIRSGKRSRSLMTRSKTSA